MTMVLSEEKLKEIVRTLQKLLTPAEFDAVQYFAVVRDAKEFYEIFMSRWATVLNSPDTKHLADASWTASPHKPAYYEFMGHDDRRKVNLCYAIQLAAAYEKQVRATELAGHRSIPSVVNLLSDVRELIQDDLMVVLDGQPQKLITSACQVVVHRVNDGVREYNKRVQEALRG